MKAACQRSNKDKNVRERSILDYFSKSNRKTGSNSLQKTPSSLLFDTPATSTPIVCIYHLADGAKVTESETAVSVVSTSDLAAASRTSSKPNTVGGTKLASGENDKHLEPATPVVSTPISCTTLVMHKPCPSPRQGPGILVHCKKNGDPFEMGTSAMRSTMSTETPPSNDTQITTPLSPPSPDAWMARPVDEKENDKNCTERKYCRNSEASSMVRCDVETPLSLLGANNAPSQNESRRQYRSVKPGTPSIACTPLTATYVNLQPKKSFGDFLAVSAAMSSNKKPSKAREIDHNSMLKQKRTPDRLPKRQKRSNQLFLDFGQNSFGKQTICNICGMLRVHGLEEDDAQHAKICKDYKEGVACLGWKNERRVMTFGKDDKVLEVRPDDSPQHRKKVLEVKTIVDKELGFSNKNGASMTSYMYISKKRVVGILLVKRIQRAYKLLPNKGEGANNNNSNAKSLSISRSLEPSKALLGVHQIWVHRAHRHHGIASRLVTVARDRLIFGMMVPLELLAFSSPTDEGLRFAKSYVGSERPLIYDIH